MSGIYRWNANCVLTGMRVSICLRLQQCFKRSSWIVEMVFPGEEACFWLILAFPKFPLVALPWRTPGLPLPALGSYHSMWPTFAQNDRWPQGFSPHGLDKQVTNHSLELKRLLHSNGQRLSQCRQMMPENSQVLFRLQMYKQRKGWDRYLLFCFLVCGVEAKTQNFAT